MSEFAFYVEKITGVASDRSVCSIFHKRVSLSDGSIGTFVGCVLASSGDEDVGIVARDMFELAVSKLDLLEGSILENLDRVREISKEFVTSRKVDTSFIYAFFYEDVCYVVREGDKVKVKVFDGSRSVELSFKSGSGPVRQGQLYLIATEKFLLAFDTLVLSGEKEIDFADVIDGLATEVSAHKDQSEIGAVFVQVRGEGTGERKETIDNSQLTIDKSEQNREIKDEITDVDEEDTTAVADEREGPSYLTTIFDLPGKILAAILRELKRLRGGEADARTRLRRNIVILALAVFLILAGSAAYTLSKNQEKKKLDQFEVHLSAASSKFAEGLGIIDLNLSRAREILIDADREVKLALEIDSENKKAKSLEGEITGKLKETEVSANINFETVSEFKDGISSLSLSGKKLVAVDGSTIFEIDPVSKPDEEIGQQASVSGAVVYDNKVFLLGNKKVFRLDLLGGKSSEFFEHDGAVDIGVFFGNVYLLLADGISKYVPVENGYSGPSDYLSAGQQFSDKSRFAIDGLVWVTNGSKVLKFNRGEKQDFEISGLVGGVGDLGSIYTTSSFDNLYIIDVSNSALLVIDKEGVYKKAYQSPEFGKAVDLVVSEDESEVYIAVGNKVLEAGL